VEDAHAYRLALGIGPGGPRLRRSARVRIGQAELSPAAQDPGLRHPRTRALRAIVSGGSPSYLAGLLAQAYDVPLESAWAAAREQMRDRTREACYGQASTSQARNFSMSLDFSDESWRYVLVPAYVAAYRYGGQSYHVMVNGQTGAIAGQRPVDWTRVWLAVAAMVAPGLLLGLLGVLATVLGAVMLPSLAIGGGVLLVALVLLIIGGIFAVITLNKARGMDDV